MTRNILTNKIYSIINRFDLGFIIKKTFAIILPCLVRNNKRKMVYDQNYGS